MAFLHERMLIMQVSLVMVAVATTAVQLALPNCPDKCEDVTIPYPFGVTEKCYMGPEFFISCTANGTEPIAYLAGGNLPVTNISLEEGELQIQMLITKDCYDEQGVQTNDSQDSSWIETPEFTISATKNRFMAVGCDTVALFGGYRGEEQYMSGCTSFCQSIPSVNDSCSGIGCCQTSIPSGLKKQNITLESYYNHSWSFNLCSFAFVVENGQFTFSGETSFQVLNNTTSLPMILNWEIGKESCSAAQKRVDYPCHKKTTKCVDRVIGKTSASSGYFCQCLPGYQGNPYLPDGCQDIDECALNSTLCKNGKCKNLPGNYSCSCNSGYKNQDAITCIKPAYAILLKITLGIPLSILVLVVASFCIYQEMKNRKFNKLKQKYFEDNGGLFLKQELASYAGSVRTAARIFTEEELKKATNNYHVSKKIGEGGYGTVYRGILSNEQVVAIKKSKVSAPITESRQFVNEVIVLSQIHHKNVVRLIGCCLETQTPILVYEFIAHGTLYEHIHRKNNKATSPLSLPLRLKIASDTAEALAYLHYSTSTPIIHRDVKATNILLDENYTAKVSDFGASRLVPDQDENKLSTFVQGTVGYLDPEYLQSNILTEKSDVYSFGVVLVELLTSQRAFCFEKPEAERSLAKVFVSLLDSDRLGQILDDEIVEGHFERVTKVADLAKRCLRLRGEERPSMKEVAAELDRLVPTMELYPSGGKPDFPRTHKDTDYLLGSPVSSSSFVDIRGEGDAGSYSSILISADYERSMQNQIQMVTPHGDGR
ncbi:wall-associated receptor kinase 2-like [Prunus dulcis]|uniref:wall-associated receptor kinase 2-like n=1 Tax=Prunus dulcis TaxID=3755 RepID=UPI001482C4DA|nr:wall-associated receptor kinase 2-like [Prunus dulcis]